MGRLVTVPNATPFIVDFGGPIQTIEVYNSSTTTGAYIKVAWEDDPQTFYTIQPGASKGLDPWDTSDDIMEGRHCLRSIIIMGQGVASVVAEIDWTSRTKVHRGYPKEGPREPIDVQL